MTGAESKQMAPDRRHDGEDAMGWLTEHPALGWVAIALVLGVVELATLDFIFLMLVGGAFAAALAAGFGVGFVGQVIIAVLAAFMLLALIRPIVVRRVRSGDPTLTGTAALVGRDALVVETVTTTGGRVKLAGEVWSARVVPGSAPDALLPGLPVRVHAIDGATALVVPTGRVVDPSPTEMRPS